MLKCTKCLLDKHPAEFTHASNSPSRGFKHYWCRTCNAQQYINNRERHKLQSRTRKIRVRYGLSLEEYDRLIKQGCSVCGERDRRIVMDHCHATNSVRAPLCDGCNLALGAAKDDPLLLRQLAAYLERHGEA